MGCVRMNSSKCAGPSLSSSPGSPGPAGAISTFWERSRQTHVFQRLKRSSIKTDRKEKTEKMKRECVDRRRRAGCGEGGTMAPDWVLLSLSDIETWCV
eukprot:1663149-Rhodomonas_salina.3